MIRVVIADDEGLIRDGFRMILRARPEIDVVAEAADGVEAVEAAHRHRPDVVLMDVRMPRLDGIDATARIVAAGLPTRVLMLTTFDRDEYVYEAMKAGASGFLLKTVPTERLIESIRLVAQGEALLAPEITRRLIEDFVRRPGPGDGHAVELERLTGREREVLVEVARGHSNGEIARTLFLSEATVKTYLTRILMKLHLRDRAQAVVFAYENGVVRPGAATGHDADRSSSRLPPAEHRLPDRLG
jgi:DNA-binding NarL/FixJ family response regulator